MKKPVIIEFKGYNIELRPFVYNNKKIGISLIGLDNTFHGPLTINMDSNINPEEIMVKDWDFNKGLYMVLLEKKLVKKYRRTIDVGLNKAFVCELTDEFRDAIYE
jgi:hypothetical protein